MKITCRLLLLLLFLLAACRQPEAGPTAGPATATRPDQPAATVLPATTATLQKAPTALPSPTAAAPYLAPWPASLREQWSDPAAFGATLLPGERPALDTMDGAPLYQINLALSGDLSRLEGEQFVTYTNTSQQPLHALFFHLFPNRAGAGMKVSNILVEGQPVDGESRQQGALLRLPLPQPLAAGEQVTVQMAFAATIPSASPDLFGTFSYSRPLLSLAHFYPVMPTLDGSGWNVQEAPYGDLLYAPASFYLVQVTAPAGLTLVASGTRLAQENAGPWTTHLFASGPARDFMVAGSEQFQPLSTTVGATTIHSYWLPGREAGAQAALEATAVALATYSRLFGPYPYPELKVVPAPVTIGGMEYPGLFLLREEFYQGMDSWEGRTDLELLAAHETAHQWFYNLVGSDQLDEPWLDEGLAQYATSYWVEAQYSEETATGYLDSLQLPGERRVKLPIGLAAGAYPSEAAYYATVYNRGALFFRALAQSMGEPAFADFLHSYTSAHHWSLATPAALQAHAEAACGCELGPLFREWGAH